MKSYCRGQIATDNEGNRLSAWCAPKRAPLPCQRGCTPIAFQHGVVPFSIHSLYHVFCCPSVINPTGHYHCTTPTLATFTTLLRLSHRGHAGPHHQQSQGDGAFSVVHTDVEPDTSGRTSSTVLLSV